MGEEELRTIKYAAAPTFKDIQALVAKVEQLSRQALIADEVENTLVDVNTRLEAESAQLKERLERAALREGQVLLEFQFLQIKLAIATEALEHIAEEGFDAYDRESAGEALTRMIVVRASDG